MPYYKGAFFYRKVAELVGVDNLDRSLGAFYGLHRTEAARMQEMIDHLERRHPQHAAQIEALANSWLRSLECPIDVGSLCPTQ